MPMTSESLDNTISREKLRGPELRSLAMSGSSEQCTVLVELDLPLPFINPERIDLGQHGSKGPVRFLQPQSDPEDLEQRVDETREALAELIGQPPKWLNSAQTFVVRAAGSQLLSIADLPHVRAVWPNTKTG
jgi:hypothetical protein